MGKEMARTTCIATLTAVILISVLACSSEPQEALVVAAPKEMDHAVVLVDGEQVGTLTPLGPGPRWFSKFLDRLWGENPVLEVVALVIDLKGVPVGPHTVTLQRPGYQDIQRNFNYPTDLEYGAIYVHFDEPPAGESDEHTENPA